MTKNRRVQRQRGEREREESTSERREFEDVPSNGKCPEEIGLNGKEAHGHDTER